MEQVKPNVTLWLFNIANCAKWFIYKICHWFTDQKNDVFSQLDTLKSLNNQMVQSASKHQMDKNRTSWILPEHEEHATSNIGWFISPNRTYHDHNDAFFSQTRGSKILFAKKIWTGYIKTGRFPSKHVIIIIIIIVIATIAIML